MSKRLPYFQFEPAEYLAGDIMFCSYGAQGMFNNICALYWQKDCELKYSQIVKRFGNEELIKELVNEKIIKVDKDKISINFLNEQYSKATVKHVINSDNGRKGALKRWRKDSEVIATPLKTDSETIALREDNIKEDEIIKEKRTQKPKTVFIPPLEIEVINYFKENGYSESSAKKAFDYYNIAEWSDSRGNKIKNWKQKMISVWFKEENKISKQPNQTKWISPA